PVHGGYFWETDLAGKVTDDRKILYGHAFAIYAMVEYHRASGEPAPLRAAIELYRLIQRHAHDDAHGGWVEHFERDWQQILDTNVHVEVEIAGCKSANTHLHLMEAFAELAELTRDADVIRSLAEALQINQQHFYPRNPNDAVGIRHPDWRPVPGQADAELSYGHNVEFEWLILRPKKVLGCMPSMGHFEAYIRHAWDYGADAELGGLFHRGPRGSPATAPRQSLVGSSGMARCTDRGRAA
ncbi:MAG: AGE family epimerase/isomerase, partial [Verrucomicrobiae bacterium]|nr:AGE family epimerase/isomerase [Verrucomicrobiae bacterium]